MKTIDDICDDAHAAPGEFYFGEPWPSGVCDEGERVEVPVGLNCRYCDEPVEETHQGSFVFSGIESPEGWHPVPVHKECSLRSVMGGYKHALGIPHERGDCDPPGMTARVSALVMWECWAWSKGRLVDVSCEGKPFS